MEENKKEGKKEERKRISIRRTNKNNQYTRKEKRAKTGMDEEVEDVEQGDGEKEGEEKERASQTDRQTPASNNGG